VRHPVPGPRRGGDPGDARTSGGGGGGGAEDPPDPGGGAGPGALLRRGGVGAPPAAGRRRDRRPRDQARRGFPAGRAGAGGAGAEFSGGPGHAPACPAVLRGADLPAGVPEPAAGASSPAAAPGGGRRAGHAAALLAGGGGAGAPGSVGPRGGAGRGAPGPAVDPGGSAAPGGRGAGGGAVPAERPRQRGAVLCDHGGARGRGPSRGDGLSAPRSRAQGAPGGSNPRHLPCSSPGEGPGAHFKIWLASP
jgi:translation initiation factor IF-2